MTTGLSSLIGSVSLQAKADALAAVTGLQNPVANGFAVGGEAFHQYTLGTGATVGLCDEVISVLEGTIAPSGNITLDLSAGFTDLGNQTATTVARVRSFLFELLATDASGAAAPASSVTVGNAASNAWTGGPLGATDTYTVNNGAKWAHDDTTAAGMLVGGSSKSLKILNNDATGGHNAAYRITFFGAHS